jgi:hypothetical protein
MCLIYSTLHVLPLNVPVLLQTMLPLEVSVHQQSVLSVEVKVSGLQQPMEHPNVSVSYFVMHFAMSVSKRLFCSLHLYM